MLFQTFLHRINPNPWLLALSGLAITLILALTGALFGIFSSLLTSMALLCLCGGIGLAFFLLGRSRDWWRLGVIGGLICLSILVAVRTEPSLFTGRDQGSLAIASLELSKNHELAFRTTAADAFFAIYGPGRALNFPGFAYTDTGALITQFPLGYISYLALFAQWFGPNGLLVGNAFLFVLSGWTFFELCSLFVNRRIAVFGTLLFATSFLMVWLTQLTLTENLALLLFLALTLALTRLVKDEAYQFLPLVILLGFLLALTRIEGFLIAPIAFGFILFKPSLRNRLFSLPKLILIPAFLFLGFLLLRDLFMNLPFYTMIAKAGTKYWHELGSMGTGTTEPSLGPIFVSYGLFLIFLLGLTSLLFGLMRRRFSLFIPVLLAAPTFLYLLNGHISDDHPWLLRRYAFTLFPLFLLATVVLWNFLEEKLSPPRRLLFGLSCFMLLLIPQAGPALVTWQVVEHRSLQDQARDFAHSFGAHDLILIDRMATGDPYAMLPGPLASVFGKQAVYFFNPADYARLDRDAFEHIYLLTTTDSLGRYAALLGNSLLPVEQVTFTYPDLDSAHGFAWPVEKIISSEAILYEITL